MKYDNPKTDCFSILKKDKPIKIFKFGGASIKDADSVRNIARILDIYSEDRLFIVISAMGKCTNVLEEIVTRCFEKKPYITHLTSLASYHLSIAAALAPGRCPNPIISTVEKIFSDLEKAMEQAAFYTDFDALYDTIVPFGELLSSHIVHEYLNLINKRNHLVNAFDWVKTDCYFRSAKVNMETSTQKLQKIVLKKNDFQIFITQGFIGSTADGRSSTLGREGSDYTAALAGAILQAESVTFWKDVPGLFNADPKRMANSHKIDAFSYREVIELAYYGAKILHPKTIKPIENHNIPLYIKSFLMPEATGTRIGHEENEGEIKTPFFIFHDRQILLSISVKDLSFITEESLHHIFGILSQCRIQVHLMQNSAISFSICIDNDPVRCKQLISMLSKHYEVLYNENLELITVRHYTLSDLNNILSGKEILLEQRSRITAQFVVRNV